ncbi:hypothetical protein QNA26_29605 [Rhodococcus qingshengii]|nr:hypothetical protein [Rhodococcus qingshengii]
MVTALCASNVYLAVAHRDAEAAKAQRLAYVQAARQGVVNILSVNFNTADSDVQRILDGATGAWRDEFSPQAAPFIDVVKQAQVVTTADITEAGLERIGDDDTAQVLIAATSKVTNAAGANEDPRSFRVRVSLSRDSGQLKVSKMEYVPS